MADTEWAKTQMPGLREILSPSRILEKHLTLHLTDDGPILSFEADIPLTKKEALAVARYFRLRDMEIVDERLLDVG